MKPVRGEKVLYFPAGVNVTILEAVGKDSVKVIMPPYGMLQTVLKTELNLPVIDTQFYEKIADVHTA